MGTKTYEYKILAIYPGTVLSEWDLNELGKEGFRVAAHVDSSTIMYDDNDGVGVVTSNGTQLVMEKTKEI